MTNDSFIKFPNYLVWNYTDNKDTLINKYGGKITFIMSYLDGHTNRLGDVVFSLEDMITNCGFKCKSGKGNITQQFRVIIKKLIEDRVLEVKNDVDIMSVKVGKLIKCNFNLFKEQKNHKGFFPLYHRDYLKIVDSNSDFDKTVLFNLYCYILARLKRREVGKGDIRMLGGKAEVFYGTYINICEDLRMSEETLNKYLKHLSDIGLLFYDNIGIVQNDFGKSVSNNVYAISEIQLKYGLQESKLYYTDNGYKVDEKLYNQKIKELERRIIKKNENEITEFLLEKDIKLPDNDIFQERSISRENNEYSKDEVEALHNYFMSEALEQF